MKEIQKKLMSLMNVDRKAFMLGNALKLSAENAIKKDILGDTVKQQGLRMGERREY
jgi:hypothetical protein